MQSLYGKTRKFSVNIEVGLVTLFLTVIAYLSYLLIFPLNSSINVSDSIVFIMSWLGIFLAIYILITWKKLTGLYFSLYTIFMLFFFMFNFGQSMMWAFGIHIPSEIGSNPLPGGLGVPTNADIVNGQMFTLISALMFHFGAIICYKPTKFKSKNERSGINKPKTQKAIFIVSIIIGSVAIPITIISAFDSLHLALTSGYKALYYSDYAENKSSIVTLINMFFFPSLVGLLIGSSYNKKVLSIVYFIFALYLIVNLLAGDRGSWIYKIVILVWLIHVCYKPINFRKMTKYIVVSIIGLYVVEAIVSVRNVGLSSITLEEFIDAFSFENSPLISTMFEMGGSMSVVITLLMYGWDIWPYTNTYMLAILGMVTNEIIYAFDVPFSLISSWYSQEYLGISWGAGFSIVAEALLNSNPYIAPFIMMVLGYIISTMIYTDKNMNYKERPLLFFFMASSLHAFLPVTRGFFHLLLKDWFYGVVLYVVLIIIMRTLLFRSNGKPIKE